MSDTPATLGGRAWQLLLAQTALGPRAPGSEGHRLGIELIADTLAATGVAVRRHCFEIRFRGGPLALTNVGATFGADRPGPALLVGSHFDTRWRADRDPDPERRDLPILGANDGGSGTALMLALAEHLRDAPPPGPVQLVFFDGEDLGGCGDESDDETVDYAIGSERWAAENPLPRPGAVVVLDLVGGRDLRLNRELHSELTPDSRRLTNLIFEAGRRRNLEAFFPVREYAITCDHVPFLRRGVPASCLIDLDYPQWHTHADTPEACSAEALTAVGMVLINLLGGELTGHVAKD